MSTIARMKTSHMAQNGKYKLNVSVYPVLKSVPLIVPNGTNSLSTISINVSIEIQIALSRNPYFLQLLSVIV